MPKEQTFTVSREEWEALTREVRWLRAEVTRVCAPSVMTVILESAAQVFCVTAVEIVDRGKHQAIALARLAVWVVAHRLCVHPRTVIEKLNRTYSMATHMRTTAAALLATDRDFANKVDTIEKVARKKIETIF